MEEDIEIQSWKNDKGYAVSYKIKRNGNLISNGCIEGVNKETLKAIIIASQGILEDSSKTHMVKNDLELREWSQ